MSPQQLLFRVKTVRPERRDSCECRPVFIRCMRCNGTRSGLDIHVQAWLVVGTPRGLDIPVQACFVGENASWLGHSCPSTAGRRGRFVAWTFLSKRGWSAGTPTLRRVVRRRGRRRYARLSYLVGEGLGVRANRFRPILDFPIFSVHRLCQGLDSAEGIRSAGYSADIHRRMCIARFDSWLPPLAP